MISRFKRFFIALLLVSHCLLSQAELPPEVQGDLLKDDIVAAIKSKDFNQAQQLIAEYRRLGIDVPAPILFLDARVAMTLNQPEKAQQALEAYFKSAGRGDKNYRKALDLYKQARNQAQQQRQQREQERERERQAALQRQQEAEQKEQERQRQIAADKRRKANRGRFLHDTVLSGINGKTLAANAITVLDDNSIVLAGQCGPSPCLVRLNEKAQYLHEFNWKNHGHWTHMTTTRNGEIIVGGTEYLEQDSGRISIPMLRKMVIKPTESGKSRFASYPVSGLTSAEFSVGMFDDNGHTPAINNLVPHPTSLFYIQFSNGSIIELIEGGIAGTNQPPIAQTLLTTTSGTLFSAHKLANFHTKIVSNVGKRNSQELQIPPFKKNGHALESTPQLLVESSSGELWLFSKAQFPNRSEVGLVRFQQDFSRHSKPKRFVRTPPGTIRLFGVVPVADNGMLMLAQYDTVDGKPESTMLMVRLDSSGNSQWSKRHNLRNLHTVTSVARQSDGTLVVVGPATDNGDRGIGIQRYGGIDLL